jgi:uncharacterized protein (DUF1778 family)
MSAAEELRKRERIELRATSRQLLAIDEAAAALHKNRSDFVLDATFQEAARVLADQRTFVLGDVERDEFLRLLDRPPSVKPRLRSLVERGSVLAEE